MDKRRLAWERQGTRRAYKFSSANYDVPEELPTLPKTWRYVPVERLSTKVVDGVHKKPDYRPQGIPFLTVRNLTAGPGIDISNVKYVSNEDHLDFVVRANPQRGDILITKDGTLGVVRAIRSSETFSIFVSLALVKPVMYEMTDYLELALQSPVMQRQMVGVGSGLQHIHLVDLKKDLVPLAPLAEQTVIVARVREAFAAIDSANKEALRAADFLDRLDQAAFEKAFRGELVPQTSGEQSDFSPGGGSLAAVLNKARRRIPA